MRVKMEDNETFTTEGRSSVKVKVNNKGQVSAEVKVYKDDTYQEVEKVYQLAVEFIDRIRARYNN